MTALDYIFYSLVLVLLVVYLSQHDMKEGYSPTIKVDDEDSELVMLFKYVFYFASVIAYFVIKWPYSIIANIINIPVRFTQEMFLAMEPMLNMIMDSFNSMTQIMSEAFMTLFKTAKEMFNIVKDLPRLMKSMVNLGVDVAKSIFSALGGLADAVKSMMSFFMAIPKQLINITKQFGTLMMKFPQMLMKFPIKGMDMMMNFTDQINSQLG